MISEGKFMDVIRGFVRFVIASWLSAVSRLAFHLSFPRCLRGTNKRYMKEEYRRRRRKAKETHLPKTMVQTPIPIHKHSPSFTQTSTLCKSFTPLPLVLVFHALVVMSRTIFQEVVIETIFL
jgi:hypothetical protein